MKLLLSAAAGITSGMRRSGTERGGSSGVIATGIPPHRALQQAHEPMPSSKAHYLLVTQIIGIHRPTASAGWRSSDAKRGFVPGIFGIPLGQ
jgi:hypothetical protein